MTPNTPPLPAPVDPQAAGLLSVREPMSAEALHMCELEIKAIANEYPLTSELLERLFDERADLARLVEEQQAEAQHLIDDASALAETEFHDQRKYRGQVAAVLRGLLVPVDDNQDIDSFDEGMATAYGLTNQAIHEAARALGLTL